MLRALPVCPRARTVLDELFSCLTAWLAPILCFTAEEAWLTRFPAADASVHLRQFPTMPADWRDDALAEKWLKVRALRRVVTGALEQQRQAKRIGSSLQASPVVHAADGFVAAVDGVDLGEICITSGAELIAGAGPDGGFTLDDVPGIVVVPAPAEGQKCARCWMVLPEVGAADGSLCRRCADAVA